jgi:NAD(P)-dependent dehydrogenase (short-subunit alcohol dehydrogenase family)
MQTVVITGSTRGLGLCLAREFLKAGCCVTVSGKSAESLNAAAEALSAYRDRVLLVACDVRLKADVVNLWNATEGKWGQVDIWVNNAGRNCPYEFAFDTQHEYVDAVVDTNIKGMIFGSQVAAKNMLLQASGQIWNMEGLGSDGMIQIKTILYGTTKRALTYFTKGLAKELEGTPVLAGRLSPGMMLTDFMLKTPDGEKSPAIEQQDFRKVFNILADKPETVAAFFVPRMLANRKNGAQISWMSGGKAMGRFAAAPFSKRKLI